MSDPEVDPLSLLHRELGRLEQKAEDRWDPSNLDSMTDWLEQEIGLTVRAVPKIKAIVEDVVGSLQRRERIRVAVLGPRGGGKTMLAAALQVLSVRFFGASWTSLGGSMEQANRLSGWVASCRRRWA